MTLPFTPITADTDLQAISGPLGEMCAAMDERVQAITGDFESEFFPRTVIPHPWLPEEKVDPVDITAGDDIQAVAFWSYIQQLIEILAPFYLDYEATIDNQTAFPYLTVARLRQLAGLHADGFRRVTAYDPAINDWTDPNDPMYSHGPIQAGDIIGPWLFQDIEACLSELKWTVHTPGWGSSALSFRTIYGEMFVGTCDDAVAHFANVWACTAWEEGGDHGYRAWLYFDRSGSNYFCSMHRNKARPSGSVPYWGVPCAVAVVLKFTGITNYPFYDFDALGMPDNGLLTMDNWDGQDPPVEVRGGDVDGAAWLGADDTAPVSSISCPVGGGTIYRGLDSSMYWVLKWEFTNA